MLHGEYGVFYGHDYFFDVCAQQGIVFQIETPTPIRLASSDGWFVSTFVFAITCLEKEWLGGLVE